MIFSEDKGDRSYANYCDKDATGAYVFLFRNKDALELEEINDYFIELEGFLNVRSAGDNKGFRFVRFKTFEAAKKAMDKTKNHSGINLLPYRNSKLLGSKKENVDKSNKSENKKVTEIPKDTSKSNKSDKIIALIKKLSTSRTIKADNPEAKKIETRSDDIPPLATTASEVVVANVHPSINAAYILHLLEKYEPLAVSYMKTVPYKNLRYCHVYFKTAVHAMKAERRLDRYDLQGNRLIVLRPSEAGLKLVARRRIGECS